MRARGSTFVVPGYTILCIEGEMSLPRTPHLASFVDSWVEAGCMAGAVIGVRPRGHESVNVEHVSEPHSVCLLTHNH